MPIVVQHSPDPYLVGVGAYGAGVAQHQDTYAKVKDAQAFEQQQLMLQLQAQAMRQYQSQLAQQQMQQQQFAQQQEMARFEQQSQAEQLWAIQKAKQEQVQWEYTQGQQQKLQKLQESYAYLDQSYASGEISDYQAEQMARQLDAEYMGIRKMPSSAQNRYPEGTEPGKVFTIATDQDAQFFGYPKMTDHRGNPIPLVRDPETGNIEIMRNWQFSKGEEQQEQFQLKQQQHQEDLRMKQESHQQDMQIKQQQKEMDLQAKAQQNQENMRIKQQGQAMQWMQQRMKPQVGPDGAVIPGLSHEQAMTEVQQFFPGAFSQGDSQGAPMQAPVGQPEQTQELQLDQQLQSLVEKGLPIIQDPQTGEAVVDPSVYQAAAQSVEAPVLKQWQGWDQEFTKRQYLDGVNAVRGVAWLRSQPGFMKIPAFVMAYREFNRTIGMSGVNGMPEPKSYQDFNAIPVGTPYMSPDGPKVK